jgi:hypothetical protein
MQPRPTGPDLPDDIASKNMIAELVNSWAFFRDQERWAELLAVFHEDGHISISWIDAPYATFVEASKFAATHGTVALKHQLGPALIKLSGNRAISEANVTIMMRSTLDSVEIDMTSNCRFLDRVERRNGTWKILRRTGIYERDRVDPVTADSIPKHLFADLDCYPNELRFLASTFKKLGLELSATVVCNKTPEMRKLYADADRWLADG